MAESRPYYLYIASSPLYKIENLWKLGLTTEPRGRLSTYLTGCPPGRKPSARMEFYALFLTSAADAEKLGAHEDELLDAFDRYRLQWRIPGDSEWFKFPPGSDAVKAVCDFVEKRPWCQRRVAPGDALASDKRRPSRVSRNYCKNPRCIRTKTARDQKLTELQEPEIEKLRLFLLDSHQRAGYCVAPCGSGKTRMAHVAIERAKVGRCIVVAPTSLVEDQWTREMSDMFASGALCREANLRGKANELSDFLAQDRFCLVINRASTPKLIDSSATTQGLERAQLLVLDECHHFAGEAAEEDESVGRTRAVVLRAKELGIKQLGLTYTPRIVRGGRELKVVSMDDPIFFGGRISEMHLKTLIEAGVLPDYRIWLLSDPEHSASDLAGKLNILKEAWGEREIRRKLELLQINGETQEIWREDESCVFNHLIVYALHNKEARDIEDENKEASAIETCFKPADTEIIRVQGGQDLSAPLRRFGKAKRAILLNCKVLAEGADIPRADSVFITYHKESRAEITQMLLRPGRWREGKTLFHILLTLSDEDDLLAVEEVLLSLASSDDRLKEEIIRRSASGCTNAEEDERETEIVPMTSPELIVAQQFKGSDTEDVRRCFATVRRWLTPVQDWHAIQDQCVKTGIKTSRDYNKWREVCPELPEDPRPAGKTWYAFLNPVLNSALSLVSEEKFIHDVFGGVSVPASAEAYDALRLNRGDKSMPSVQNIVDECYGVGKTFDVLRAKANGKCRSKKR